MEPEAFTASLWSTPTEATMVDDKTKTAADRKRIDVHEDYECRYWSEKFGVSADELKRTVATVGNRVDEVARALGK
jgi:hypothetical protein